MFNSVSCGNWRIRRNVTIVDSVPGIHLQTETCRAQRRRTQTFHLLVLDLFREGIGECAGVQLDHVGAEFARGLDLLRSRIDKKTDANPGGMQPINCRLQSRARA